MSIFYFTLDLTPIESMGQNLLSAAQEALNRGGAALTAATHAHILELTHQELHSRRQAYEDALTMEQVNNNTWVINLGAKARWIEDGIDRHSMIEDLLKSPKAKTAKDGSKYLAVPFEHSRGPASTPSAQYDLTSTVRSFLKNYNKQNPQSKIPYGKIERNPDGSPKLGLLHKFDVMTGPIKTHEGAFQGRGPVGSVRQGWTGTPFLQGIRIYQKMVKDKTGYEHVKRSIVTFRTVSSKQKGTGKWEHPGLEPKNFIDRSVDWALKEWDDKVLPQILDEVYASI